MELKKDSTNYMIDEEENNKKLYKSSLYYIGIDNDFRFGELSFSESNQSGNIQ